MSRRISLFSFVVGIWSCLNPGLAQTASRTAASNEFEVCAQSAVTKVERGDRPKLKKEWSRSGIDCADQCLQLAPSHVPCHYYRAVNRGHLLETQLIPSGDSIRLMRDDFLFVVAHEEGFDEAGALRALAEIYSQLPTLPVYGKDLVRDLQKAYDYASRAVRLAPQSRENQECLGKIEKLKPFD